VHNEDVCKGGIRWVLSCRTSKGLGWEAFGRCTCGLGERVGNVCLIRGERRDCRSQWEVLA
jgi:hypothetical protein